MAVTLAQAATLSQNKLQKGIIEELIYESPLMRKIPFVELVGNALAVNREDTTQMGSVAFKAVDEVWAETTAAFSQTTFSLYSLGGDADVPNLIQKSRSNLNDQMAAQVKVKTKLMAHAFEDQSVYGVAASSKGFDGMHTFTTASGVVVHCGASSVGAALTLAKLDEGIDKCKAGKPDLILMNKNIRRKLAAYLRTVGSYQTERDDYGDYFMQYNGIPIVVTDWITQTEAVSAADPALYSAKTGGVTSSVFIVHFGEEEGITGIQNGGIETEVWEKLESKDASRTRIKWYVGLCQYATQSLVCIDGITDVTVTA